MKRLVSIVILVSAAGLLACVARNARESSSMNPVPSTAPTDPGAAALRRELYDLHRLSAHDYQPFKTSFVLGLEGMSGCPRRLEPGDSRVLVDVRGTGSLRHIWQTHGPDASPFVLEFYVDGETTPSISGRPEDLIDAARATTQSLVMVPGRIIEHHSRNLYLPVPFDRSLRVELRFTDNYGLIFLQLDGRVGDDSLKGARLVQEPADAAAEASGGGAGFTLRYENLPPRQALPADAFEMLTRQTAAFRGNRRIALGQGPGIVRRLGVNRARQGVRMRIYCDGAAGPAIDVDMADFFGPFRGTALNNNSCYLPMPFARALELEIDGASADEEWRFEIDYHPYTEWNDDWGYLHARSSVTQATDGVVPHPVLMTRGRGHYIATALYATGHDHGGGDFTIVDGEGPDPRFLHGINGEDYFSFAFFGRGENFPYSEAFSNDEGRMRLHLENPYPFRESLAFDWGTLPGHTPRSVAWWYQDSPEDLTLDADAARGLQWQVFGPVGVPTLEDGNTPDVDRMFAGLPPPEDLDAGKPLRAEHRFDGVHEGTFEGWAAQRAVGPHLNLTYVYGHVMDLGAYQHMGYWPRAMMAQARLVSTGAREVTLQLSYDDPIEVELNGDTVLRHGGLEDGFITRRARAELAAGENRLLVRMLDTPNNNTAWAGLNLRILDAAGNELSAQLQPWLDRAAKQ